VLDIRNFIKKGYDIIKVVVYIVSSYSEKYIKKLGFDLLGNKLLLNMKISKKTFYTMAQVFGLTDYL
jgi:hypothetical protein